MPHYLSYGLLIWMMLLITVTASAKETFLSPDQAFGFEAQSLDKSTIQLDWVIAPDYYLYKYQFAVKVDQKIIGLDLPQAKAKHDEYFGDTEVYYQKLSVQIPAQANQNYQVSYQGCANEGLCYPLVQKNFKTDEDGLIVLEDQTSEQSKSLWASKPTSAIKQTENQNSQVISVQNINDKAQDQQWSDKLSERSLVFSILVFLGLGFLLAFTPCSLPMLPILSSLLIRKHEGVKSIFISLTFVLCMASVYALLGVVAASAGSNFQRWLQQPFVLISFSLIFIIFALNLLGVFDLKLPQSWLNKLDGLQAKQQGGTLIGAGMMGILSALLVGPCMTAPLAGTLLYISQTQNIVAGAILLFSLGLGMGIPLLLLTLLGQKALPKPGLWMNYVRHIFAFLMLGLSVYFIRPLISIAVFNVLLLTILIVLCGYFIWIIQKSTGVVRAIAVIVCMSLASFCIWQSISFWKYTQADHQQWQTVTDLTMLQKALNAAQDNQQSVVIDVYADWCIACQPLEREVWLHPDVQQAIQPLVKIKLDLSDYNPQQQQLLDQWQLMGPPTALFINALGQEERALRLTGTFKREKLLQQIQQLGKN